MNCQQLIDGISNIDWGLLIGILALLFTAISLRSQQKHNRLSVKPIALFSFGDYENQLAVYLQNKGIGPLIITQLSFVDQNGKTEKAIINFFGPEFKDIRWDTFVDDIDGWPILPNETKTLIKFNGDPNNEDFIENRERIRKILSQIEAKLLYEDIYGKKMPKKNRKLDWFAR